RTSWPELVGVSAEEARKIKEEKPEAEIQVVPQGSFVTADYKFQRVRLYVDESNKVVRAAPIG
nr:inhibitor,subtilisin [Vicia faba]